jgi:site-specific DNA-methyltransferase (adenine-specific)
MLVAEPKERGKAPCMIVFCAFEQQHGLIELAKQHGFKGYIPLVFYKNFSPQVLKANMRIVGNCEYAILFYRDKLPKFNNDGRMVFNATEWPRDTDSPKIHPTQKPVLLLQRLIALFTDPGEVVIDPCCCSNAQNTIMHGALPRSFGSATSIFEQKCMNSAILKSLSVSKNSFPASSLCPFFRSPSLYHCGLDP